MQTNSEEEIKAELENIPAFKQIVIEKTLVETLSSLFQQFDNIEREILYVFLELKQPQSVKRLRGQIAVFTFSSIPSLILEVIKELEGKQEIKEKIQKMLKLGEPYKFDVNLFDTIAVTQFIKSASLEDYKRFRKFCSAGLRSLTDRELEEIISLYNKKFPVSIPSFYTVKKILEDFEKKGIVQRRKLEGRKAPEVWHLSAPFSRVYFYTVSKLEERLTEKPTAFMKNLYSLITGKRYFYTEED